MKHPEENHELAKWLAGELSEAELAKFRQAPGYDTYVKIRSHSRKLTAPEFDADKIYGKIVHHRSGGSNVISLSRTWMAAAAMIAILLACGFFYKMYAPVSEFAANGQHHTFTLPDASEVVLNAGSEIEYKKWDWDNNRQLHLNGEAYFRVAKGKKFEVRTSLGKVTVLGTQFNVKARNNRFEVACYEGRVRVHFHELDTVITRGQCVTFSNGERIDAPSGGVPAPEWLNGELVFTKESLPNIIDELRRQYNVTIEVNSVLSAQLFTGALPVKDLDGALDILASAYHLKVGRIDGKIMIETLNVQG